MNATFQGLDLFSSGPHRVVTRPRELSIVANFQLNLPGSGSTIIGVSDWEVVIEGRLVALTSTALRTLREGFVELITDPATSGELVLPDGFSYSSLYITRYEETGLVAKGRTKSVGYRATFRNK